MGTWVLYECIVGATGCTCVVLGENGVYLIFGPRWPCAVLFFGGMSEKVKNVL
jgi:hypothetical protein